MKTLILLLPLLFTACASKIDKLKRNAKYSAYEFVGVEKRDLFKKEVGRVKDTQEETGEEFEDALSALKRLYAFDGGDLEDRYDDLNKAYERSDESSKAVSVSIKQLETVAGDLFDEWKTELESIETVSLREKSRQKLKETQSRFGDLSRQLRKAESKMAPVLSKLRDQTLFVKHNLNAAAIGSLKSEGERIKLDINQLLAEMKKSVAEADKVIQSL